MAGAGLAPAARRPGGDPSGVPSPRVALHPASARRSRLARGHRSVPRRAQRDPARAHVFRARARACGGGSTWPWTPPTPGRPAQCRLALQAGWRPSAVVRAVAAQPPRRAALERARRPLPLPRQQAPGRRPEALRRPGPHRLAARPARLLHRRLGTHPARPLHRLAARAGREEPSAGGRPSQGSDPALDQGSQPRVTSSPSCVAACPRAGPSATTSPRCSLSPSSRRRATPAPSTGPLGGPASGPPRGAGVRHT